MMEFGCWRPAQSWITTHPTTDLLATPTGRPIRTRSRLANSWKDIFSVSCYFKEISQSHDWVIAAGCASYDLKNTTDRYVG